MVAGERGGGGWEFTFTDPLVSQPLVDHRFSMRLLDGSLICLEASFDLMVRGETFRMSPGENPLAAGAALPLFNQRIDGAWAEERGGLHVAFSSGTAIRVSPIPMFESWQVQGPTGELWVGLAGGGVGVWPGNRDGSPGGSAR